MPTIILPFGPFQPDRPQEKGGTLTRAENVLPVNNTYRPVQELAVGDRLLLQGALLQESGDKILQESGDALQYGDTSNRQIALAAHAHVYTPDSPDQEIFVTWEHQTAEMGTADPAVDLGSQAGFKKKTTLVKGLGNWRTSRRDSFKPEEEINKRAWDDVTCIVSPADPRAEVCRFDLTQADPPDTSGSFTFYYRLWVGDAKKDPSWTFTVRIKLDRPPPDDLDVAGDTVVHTEVVTGTAQQYFTTGSFVLSPAEVALISDWSRLYVEFEANVGYDSFLVQENADKLLTGSGDYLALETFQVATPTGDADSGKWEDEFGGLFNLYAKLIDSDDDSYAISNLLALGEEDSLQLTLSQIFEPADFDNSPPALLQENGDDILQESDSPLIQEDYTPGDSMRVKVRQYATNTGIDATYRLYTTGNVLVATGFRESVKVASVSEETIPLYVEDDIAISDVNWDDLEIRVTATYTPTTLQDFFTQEDGEPLLSESADNLAVEAYSDNEPTESAVWAKSRPAAVTTDDDGAPLDGEWSANNNIPADLADDSDATKVSSTAQADTFTVDFGAFNLDASNASDDVEQELVVRAALSGATASRTLKLEILENAEVVATKRHTVSHTASATDYTWDVQAETGVTAFRNMRVRVTAVGSGGTMEVYSMTLRLAAARRLVLTGLEFITESRNYMKVSHFLGLFPPSASSRKTDREDKVAVIVGTQEHLYEVGIEGWTMRTKGRPAPYTQTPFGWSLASWGSVCVATNRVDNVQKMDFASETEFSDLFTSTAKPKAQFCAVARDQLFLGDIDYADGYRDEVWASKIDDIADMDTGSANGVIRQRLRDTPGQLTMLVGGEVLVIFKRSSIIVGSWVGSPAYWRFDTVSRHVGTDQPRSVIMVDNVIYFIGQGAGRGLYRLVNYQSIVPIELDSRRYFFDHDYSRDAVVKTLSTEPLNIKATTFGALDHSSGLLVWYYREREDQEFENSRAIVYNPAEERATSLRIPDRNIAAAVGVPDLDYTRQPGAVLMGGIWTITTGAWS